MDRRSPSTPQIVLGVLIITIGVLFLLDNLDYIYVGDFFRYWPILLVAYGISKFLSPSGRGWGALVGIVGVLLLLRNTDVLWFRIWDFWPVILILLGAFMLYRGSTSGAFRRSDAGEGSGESRIQGFAFLGGYSAGNTSQSFEGGQLTAFLGGCEVDLTRAAIKGDRAVLDVLTFMGGIDIRVPENWRVEVQGTPVLGGFEDKSRQPTDASAKTLVVKGLAFLGGVDIKN